MKKLIPTTLLTFSLIASQAFAGPSGKSDKVITGIIVGATAAALIAAIANADEVKVYQHPQPHFKPKHQPRYERHPHKHWKQRQWRHNRWHQREHNDWRDRRYDRSDWRRH